MRADIGMAARIKVVKLYVLNFLSNSICIKMIQTFFSSCYFIKVGVYKASETNVMWSSKKNAVPLVSLPTDSCLWPDNIGDASLLLVQLWLWVLSCLFASLSASLNTMAIGACLLCIIPLPFFIPAFITHSYLLSKSSLLLYCNLLSFFDIHSSCTCTSMFIMVEMFYFTYYLNIILTAPNSICIVLSSYLLRPFYFYLMAQRGPAHEGCNSLVGGWISPNKQ